MVRTTLLLTALTLAAAGAALAAGVPGMGPAGSITRPAFHGYYDGHKDTYLNTDVSDKAQAAAMHIIYSATLNAVPLSATTDMYLVQGRAAAGQLAVFGSEPGEASYSPIWREAIVTWKAGSKPVLLVKDDQIKDLAKKGQLRVRETSVRLNCPIVKVGG